MLTLVLMTIASIALWRIAEQVAVRLDPDHEIATGAARLMTQASDVIRDAKGSRGLLQDADLDPNRTGLIGPEWSEIATTIGNLQAKRTLTNPEAAALFVRVFRKAGLRRGDPVAVIVSGSFVGGNVAVISATESLGLRVAGLASVGASMYGATDPTFTWLDMESTVREAGVWKFRSSGALLGGEAGAARELDHEPRRMLLDAVRRSGVPLIGGADFASTVRASAAALGLEAPIAGDPIAPKPAMLINVGGAQVALGDCAEAADIPPGLVDRMLPCSDGTRGLIQVALDQRIPVFNVLKIRELALRYGLAFDPVPLPRRADGPPRSAQ